MANHDPIEFFDHPVPECLRDEAPLEVDQDIVVPAPKPKRGTKPTADRYQPFTW